MEASPSASSASIPSSVAASASATTTTTTTNKQLAARVKSITGKLLESHGAELRRTLFSLRQIFQDDPELARAFVDSSGLECLLGLASQGQAEGDQIHQNYILRAIGQLTAAHASGLSCLGRHNQTLQWLYALLASQHRLVAKSSLRLLVSFVELSEQKQVASRQLCRAFELVDKSKEACLVQARAARVSRSLAASQVTGASSWTNIIELFRLDSANSSNNLKTASNNSQSIDCELLLDCISLINQTLDNLPQDQEATYFGLIEALERAGMESIIDKYSHLDKQLRDQFKLYEEKLARNSEDDHDDGDEEVGEELQQEDTAMSRVVEGDTSATDIAAQRRPVHPPSHVPHSNSSSNGIFNTSNDESNEYESANEEAPSNGGDSAPRHVGGDLSLTPPKVASGNKLVQTVNDEHQAVVTNNNRRHQLQLRSQPSVQHQRNSNLTRQQQQQQEQNNLARGKQQRASISSCSSSDSYASYGSGYASGSANSSDHEHKQKRQQRQQQLNSSTLHQSQSSTGNGGSSSNNNNKATGNLSSLTAGINNLNIRSPAAVGVASSAAFVPATTHRVKIQETTNPRRRGDDDDNNDEKGENEEEEDTPDDDDDDDEEGGEDEDEDGESHLKQHLSELEQLTDELAKRDIYSTTTTLDAAAASDRRGRNQPPLVQTNPSRHFSSTTLKSNASNASSVLSTGSNISSLSSGINSPPPPSTTTTLPPSVSVGVQQQQQVTTASAQHQFKPQLRQQATSSSSSGTPSLTIAAVGAASTSSKPYAGADESSGTDSRSASATPTSYLQPKQSHTATQATGSTTGGSFTDAAAPGLGSGPANSSPSTRTNSIRPANQYNVMPSSAQNTSNSSPARSQQESSCASSSSSSYHHNLFQWEQLVSKGVTRPLLINDLDFTDLRDEDDCDLLNSSNNSNLARNGTNLRSQTATGEPLTISIPSSGQHHSQSLDHDSVDSGASTGSPSARSVNEQPASAPPPLPPPPISPWFNTIAGGSRPQSQFMSSPSPPPPLYNGAGDSSQARDQSPAASSTYSSYSRNSVCLPNGPGPGSGLQQHFSTLQTANGAGGLRAASSMSSLLFGNNNKFGNHNNKRKKTMKLFWKEVREDRSLLSKLTKKKTIWDEIKPVNVDTQKLEYLFESKAKDLSLSKSRNGLDGLNQRKVKITVLDAKRSNAINIGMTKLPPMRTIKSAILKMDSSIMNREGIEKILTTMMPTEEEKSRIIEAQLANPETPLGTAEQFLLNLASISALEARLKLWAFQLDYSQIEKEVAEPLMDLKQAIEEIERSETFRNILGTLLSIGNFLNSTSAKGFQIDYLEKVPEVKDTVHKHSLLHHLCLFIQEKFDPELASDLYSEFSAVNRASKVDYTEVAKNLKKMQQDCKASWDHLKIVAKHDGLAATWSTCGATSGTGQSQSQSQSQSGDHLGNGQLKSAGKLNNLSKLSMITTVIGGDNSGAGSSSSSSSSVHEPGGGGPTSKQLKVKVSDFLTDCAERIMVLMVIHRRVMNRFQKLLVYLGCPSHQIKQTQPQQILKIINEFALEYRTKRERVREMLMRKQQCQHHHHHHHQLGSPANRWQQLNRMRWAGSQQCIDTMSQYASSTNQRPCSTASSCASTYATSNGGGGCPDCAMLGTSRRSFDAHQQHRHGNQHQLSSVGQHQRPGSPSGMSQISDLSDYLMDQTCCSSRQESITPVPLGATGARRPHSMSVSMMDLQHQQAACGAKPGEVSPLVNKSLDESEMLARQKDEQMRRLLGGGKSLDGACQDLYQMSHWSTTMARVTRQPPMSHKQRAASIDSHGQEANQSAAREGEEDSFEAEYSGPLSPRRQSSYYRYLHQNGGGGGGAGVSCHLEDEQNSDEEILQSLVRTVTAKSSHSGQQANGLHLGNRRSSTGGQLNESIQSNESSTSSKSAKSKILSRFNCDRKSLRRTLRPSLESNA